jgi:hypothetical protein
MELYLFVLEYDDQNGTRNLLPMYKSDIQQAHKWLREWGLRPYVEVVKLSQWSQLAIRSGSVLPGVIEVPDT